MRCGVSQPSLTNAIIALEQELGGALFQRKPTVALTMLGHVIHPYLDQIGENVQHAREAAQAMADVRTSPSLSRVGEITLLAEGQKVADPAFALFTSQSIAPRLQGCHQHLFLSV